MNQDRQKLGILALVLFVIVPLAMAPHYTSFPSRHSSEVLEERDGSDSLVRQVVHGPGGPLWQVRSDGSSQYMHEDPRGNIVMLTEGTGSPTGSPGDVLERITYDAFGKPLFQDANNQNKVDPAGGTFLAQSDFDNDLLFGGMLYDAETGSRGFTLNGDFGGLYAGYNADEGRYITRSGPGGEEIYTDKYGRVKVQFSTAGGNRYGLVGHAPVNASGGPLPQTREHILLGRQVGVPAASGRRTYEPIRIRKRIDKSSPMLPRKRPGRTTYADITLKRGASSNGGHELGHNLGIPSAGSAGNGGHELGHNLGIPSATRGKEKFQRDKIHINIGTLYADSSSFSVEREMKESGEKGGTADINIGIGEMSADEHGHFWFENLTHGVHDADEHGYFWF